MNFYTWHETAALGNVIKAIIIYSNKTCTIEPHITKLIRTNSCSDKAGADPVRNFGGREYTGR